MMLASLLLLLLVCRASAMTVSEAAQRSCETAVVSGLTRQLVKAFNEMSPGSFVDISQAPYNAHFTFTKSAQPFLQTRAAESLLRVAQARGSKLSINSALRSLAQQVLLYRWYTSGQRCGIRLASRPGGSNHQSGAAVDIEDHSAWNSAMSRNGWRWFGGADPVHFDFTGGDASFKTKSVLVFQKLYNANNPSKKIRENGQYSSEVENAILRSPAEGFPIASFTNSAAEVAPPVAPPAAAAAAQTADDAQSEEAASDAEPLCTRRGTSGVCVDTSVCTSRGGKSYGGLCAGASSIRCCIGGKASASASRAVAAVAGAPATADKQFIYDPAQFGLGIFQGATLGAIAVCVYLIIMQKRAAAATHATVDMQGIPKGRSPVLSRR